MTFGARVLKTGIAVTIALYMSRLAGMTPPVIAGIAAIFAMQPSIYRSWSYFREQLQTNAMGAALAMLAGLFFQNEPIVVGLVCIIIISLLLKFKMEDTIGLTLVTAIAVMEAPGGHWSFALNRFLLSVIGIFSAFLINVIFIPPKPKEQFVSQVQSVFDRLSLLLRTVISDEMKESVYQLEKKGLEDSLRSLESKYKLFEEEQKKMKRMKYSEVRLIVVYKQMLGTLVKGSEILDAAEEHYFPTVRSPEINARFDRQLEILIKFHEHVLLKFQGKIKPDSPLEEAWETESEEFIQAVLDGYASRSEGNLRLTVTAAEIYDYSLRISRLDKLVEQYNKGNEEKE